MPPDSAEQRQMNRAAKIRRPDAGEELSSTGRAASHPAAHRIPRTLSRATIPAARESAAGRAKQIRRRHEQSFRPRP